MDMLWVMFVIVAAEIGRYWQPFRPGGLLSRRFGVPSSRDGAQASRESGAPTSWPDLRTGARDHTVESSRSGNVGCPGPGERQPARPACVDTCRCSMGCGAWPS